MTSSLLAELASLFAAAFLAATLIPAQSEAVLTGLALAGSTPWGLLLVVASVGNTLGAVVNYVLGRGIERFRDRRWFPVSPTALERASGWWRRFGVWSLLVSWLPIVGDPLTVVAGVARVPFPLFLGLVAFGKTARYAAILALLPAS